MTGPELLNACLAAANNLDELEALRSHLPQEHHAFVFRSVPEVRELQGIARYETAARVTPEQAKHIGSIRRTIAHLYTLVPADVLEELRAEDDDD